MSREVAVSCLCPPKAGEVRHETGDTIRLRDRLDFFGASSVRNAAVVLKATDPGSQTAEVMAALTEAYILAGVESWTVQDDKGKPVECNRQTVREILLASVEDAMIVGEEADELYGAVMRPLILRAFRPSRSSQTDESMSPTNGSQPKRPKRSPQSSTTTTRTDGIATISP